MSKINLNNYEAFMLDHLEGNLSQQDILALKAFALLHPELELNFEEELVTLETEKILFENKQNLKAGFGDELVIGYLENVLEGKEKQEAEVLAANNTVFKHELELYKRTIAVADTRIVFENKERLKRRGAVIFFPQNNYVRVAAALLLLFGLWFMVSRMIKEDVKIGPEIATNKTKNTAPTNTSTVATHKNSANEETTIPKENKKLIAGSSYNSATITKKEQEINTSTVNVVVPDKKEEEPQLVDQTPKQEEPAVKPDTSAILVSTNQPAEKIFAKYIIEEGKDDEPVAQKPKSKLWNLTSGILKRLNRRGVENVNSSENNDEMFIGALTISK